MWSRSLRLWAKERQVPEIMINKCCIKINIQVCQDQCSSLTSK